MIIQRISDRVLEIRQNWTFPDASIITLVYNETPIACIRYGGIENTGAFELDRETLDNLYTNQTTVYSEEWEAILRFARRYNTANVTPSYTNPKVITLPEMEALTGIRSWERANPRKGIKSR